MSGHLNVDFKIRLPHELKDKIRRSSEQYNRTMTADIVARLEQSFAPTKATIALNATYFQDNLLKMFDEQVEIARKELKAKYENVSQEDIDAFLAWRLEQK